MAHTLTFFPLGNADCCRVDLEGGEKLLFDYAATRDNADEDDPRIDLPSALRADLEESERTYYDIVAFTHLDRDHICGASDFFSLNHAATYQGNDRVGIRELWVPAAAIIEPDCCEEAAIIQSEARYRLRQGDGIRIFSRPQKLAQWLSLQGLSLEDRRHLITDAGQPVPGITLPSHGVQFFVHSPFASRLNDGSLIDRNTNAIVLHGTFEVGGRQTKLLLLSDITYESIAQIVRISRYHDNDERLEWDIVKLPHHCSYSAIGPERGTTQTEPVDEVAWLYREQGQRAAIIVATCDPILGDGAGSCPPHSQAAAFYKEIAKELNGDFVVTMEHPSTAAPEELVIELDSLGGTVKKPFPGGPATILTQPAPRAG